MTQKSEATLKQIRVDPETGEQFREFCERTGRTQSKAASIALRQYLEAEQAIAG